jgi:hypothetical protein
VTELIRCLRKRFGEIEYLRVTEVTKSGFPHYHLLVRSAFIPQPVVKAEWSRLTKATIVDLRQVHQNFGAFSYLVKYLTKMHKLEWTERHVSYSRGFFPAAEPKTKDTTPFLTMKKNRFHPHDLLVQWFDGRSLTQIGPMHWLLDSDPSSDLPLSVPLLHPRPEAMVSVPRIP